MDDQQLRLHDDLRDVVTGEVLVDDLARAAYATDASILQYRPLAIVAPKTIEELAGVVAYAAEAGLSLHARGGGTGLAGESLGPGLMIDTARHLGRVLSLGPNTVRVEAGVRCSTLEAELSRQGRMLGPDPVSRDSCTIGGMLATDAAGPHSLRYGTIRDYVAKLRVVSSAGELLEFGREALKPGRRSGEGTVARVATGVSGVLAEFADAIRHEQAPGLIKRGGYNLRGVLRNDSLDLARLMVGSEGTLAVFAEAELATVPIPAHRGVLLAHFASLDSAALAVIESLEFQPTACELLGRRLLSLARESAPLYREWIPPEAEALLLIEQEGNSEWNVCDRLRALADRLTSKARLALTTVEVIREPELSECWAIRGLAMPKRSSVGSQLQPIDFIENTAVPPTRLPEFLRRMQNVMKRHEVTASYAAHAGVGVLHTRPLLDLRRQDHLGKLEAIVEDVFELVQQFGGTMSGEHGVGLLRSGLLPRQFPKLYPAFCRLKAIFDPHNQLNPGKIVGADPSFPTHHLRATPRALTDRPDPGTQLRWPTLTVLEEASRCNGCAACHQTDLTTRMCPTYKVLQTEFAGPRAKANLMRQVLVGDLDPRELASDELRSIADYCIHCNMCRLECPASVDVSRLMLEAKANHVAENGLQRTDWFFANLEGWSKWCSANAVFANAMLANRAIRWLIERFWGLSRYRQVPRFHHRTFLRRAARNGWTRRPRPSDERPRVALLADTFVNYHDPHLGECAVRVLEHMGYRVYVPPTQSGSGMAPLRHGDLDSAREYLRWNLGIFAELARDGYDVVSPEPSAVSMFRNEGRGLIEDPELDLLARRTYELSEYLAVLAADGRLRQGLHAIPLTVAYHEPCHQRALGPRGDVIGLMGRIPQLRLVPVEKGCTGMADTFGMRADGFELSLRYGAPLLQRLAQRDIQYVTTQCTGCRLQIEQGARKRTLHPVKWLAISYGLLTRPERLLAQPGKGLVV